MSVGQKAHKEKNSDLEKCIDVSFKMSSDFTSSSHVSDAINCKKKHWQQLLFFVAFTNHSNVFFLFLIIYFVYFSNNFDNNLSDREKRYCAKFADVHVQYLFTYY